jgi:hypothetical protein
MRLFEVNDYEEDLSKESRRMKAMMTKNPYVKDYPRKLKQPEQAIIYSRNVVLLQLLYLIFTLSGRSLSWIVNVVGKLKDM